MVAVAVLGLAGTGAIAQGVSFGGSAGMGVVYEGSTKMMDPEDATKEVTKMESVIKWISDFDVAMSASGTTDGGLTFGASATIKASNGSSVVGNSNVYIGGESWKIAIGDLDPASDKGKSLGDIGYDGLGVDDVAENIVTEHSKLEQGTKADVEVSFNLGAASLAITAGQTPGSAYTKAKVVDGDAADGKISPAVDKANAMKEDTEWAAGVGFEIGSTNLGIGIDSEKLMQASVSADLGAFGGKLYFSQQKTDGPEDLGLLRTADDAGKADNKILENKKTGIGVELSVSAGANTTISAVYAQGKQSDTRESVAYVNNGENNTCEIDGSGANGTAENCVAQGAKGMTDKGFGIGVSHNLGGGATLQAGFAKVMKQTKASVGVTMSF